MTAFSRNLAGRAFRAPVALIHRLRRFLTHQKQKENLAAPKIDQSRLDFLRGFAAVYVVVNHTRGAFYAGGERILAGPHGPFEVAMVALLQVTALGAEAVILFFVLSGFAMAHSVGRSRGAAGFYLRRLVRIWPPYIAATLFALLVGRLVGIDAVERHFWQILFYINPGQALVPQFWSLPYEVFFYLLCPLILSNRLAVQWTGFTAVVLTALTVAGKGIVLNPFDGFLANFFGNELLLFASGALTYHYFELVPRLSGRLLALSTSGLFLAAWAIKWKIGASNLGANLAIIALAVLAIRNLPDRIAAFRPLNWGFFSYSIYIFHYALLELEQWLFRISFGYEPSDITSPFAWLLAVPPILLGAFILHHVTERPCNAIVARLRRNSTQPVSVAAVAASIDARPE